jgi:SAM-dependent methyltransferase
MDIPAPPAIPAPPIDPPRPSITMRGVAHLGRDLIRNPGALMRWWRCPICEYRGPFTSVNSRRYSRCPGCESFERHRLMYLVMDQIRMRRDFGGMRMLHFSAERMLRPLFARWFGSYTTSDIAEGNYAYSHIGNGDIARFLDMRDMASVADGSFDIVVAAHVLEHIKADDAAISEVARVLAPGGIAILPVPIVAERTVEYPHPVPTEHDHVRAPGPDYYDRFKAHFERVDLYRSTDFDAAYQTWLWDDRSGYPTPKSPYRPPMPGDRHSDIVPVCFKVG